MSGIHKKDSKAGAKFNKIERCVSSSRRNRVETDKGTSRRLAGIPVLAKVGKQKSEEIENTIDKVEEMS